MSADEICNSLGIEVDPDLVVELNDHLNAVDEISSLKPRPSAKLTLVGAGGTIYAKFSPRPSGSGPCDKNGTGAFTGLKPPADLTGNHRLEVGCLTVKLNHEKKVIWARAVCRRGLLAPGTPSSKLL